MKITIMQAVRGERRLVRPQNDVLDRALVTIPIQNNRIPHKLYRHALPQALIERLDKFRERHKEHPEITTYRKDTIRFALELLLALEEAIF